MRECRCAVCGLGNEAGDAALDARLRQEKKETQQSRGNLHRNAPPSQFAVSMHGVVRDQSCALTSEPCTLLHLHRAIGVPGAG